MPNPVSVCLFSPSKSFVICGPRESTAPPRLLERIGKKEAKLSAHAPRSPVRVTANSTWDRLAPVYDLQLALERAALEAAVKLVASRPELRLLDLGTGTGAFLRKLAREPARPNLAVGVDASAEMLARVPSLPMGWSVQAADVTDLPFGDSSFDVATAAYLLHLLEPSQLAKTLAEAKRVLGPAGRLVVVVPAAPSSILARPYEAVANGLARLGPLGGLRVIDPRPALRAAGFAIREERHVTRGYPSLILESEASVPGQLRRQTDELTGREQDAERDEERTRADADDPPVAP